MLVVCTYGISDGWSWRMSIVDGEEAMGRCLLYEIPDQYRMLIHRTLCFVVCS